MKITREDALAILAEPLRQVTESYLNLDEPLTQDDVDFSDKEVEGELGSKLFNFPDSLLNNFFLPCKT